MHVHGLAHYLVGLMRSNKSTMRQLNIIKETVSAESGLSRRKRTRKFPRGGTRW